MIASLGPVTSGASSFGFIGGGLAAPVDAVFSQSLSPAAWLIGALLILAVLILALQLDRAEA